jgi:hypothetical protein
VFINKEYSILENRLLKIFRRKPHIYKIKSNSWNSVYQIIVDNNKYLLKVGIDELDGGGVGNEYRSLKLLHSRAINNVPSVKYFGRIKYHCLLLEDFIDNTGGKINGHRLGELVGGIHSIKERPKRPYGDFAAELVSCLLMRLENIREINSEFSYIPDDYILKYIRTTLKKIQSILSKKEWILPREMSFINMDYNDSIISSGNKIFIVDWHLARFGDPAWDLTRVIYYYKFSKELFFEAYYSKYNTEVEYLLRRIDVYGVLNEIFNTLLYCEDNIFLLRYSLEPFLRERKNLSAATKLLKNDLIERINRLLCRTGLRQT